MKKKDQFSIFYKDGWAWLTVYPASANEHPVYTEDIQGKLKLLGIPPVRRTVISSVIQKHEGIPQKLISWPGGENLGPKINITVTDDSMSAEMTITEGKPGGEPLSLKYVMEALKKEKIIFGIREDTIREVVKNKIYGQSFLAAAGIYPVNQAAKRKIYYFETDRGKPFREKEYGRIDLRELNFIQNTKKGSLLAQMSEQVNPARGRDIYGNTLFPKADTEKSFFSTGPGAKLSDDGDKVYAEIDGNVKLYKGRIVVEPCLTVDNVDYSNGNMDFNGALDIKGRVADGFTIKAAGDIQIGKSVSKINIESGGDMILKAGISGNDEGTLFCRGNLYARYIENAKVKCMGNIYVEEAIMHSEVQANDDIILKGKRAEIFGGKVIAGRSIICKKLGSINEPYTEVHVGLTIADYGKLVSLERSVEETAAEIDNLELKISQIKGALAKGENNKATQKKLSIGLKQLTDKCENLKQEHSRYLKELHENRRTIEILNNSHVKVDQKIFGKVTIYFGTNKWSSSGKGIPGAVVSFKNGKVVEN